MVINVKEDGVYPDGTGIVLELKKGQQEIADETAIRLAKQNPESIQTTGGTNQTKEESVLS